MELVHVANHVPADAPLMVYVPTVIALEVTIVPV